MVETDDTDLVETDMVETDDTDLVETDTDDSAVPIVDVILTVPGEHAVVVPPGVTSLTVHLWGGGGAGGSQAGATGGGGGYVAVELVVTPGETLRAQVGEGGDSTGFGGGASILLRGSTVLAVAAGGGGGGSDGNSGNSATGGAGGGGGGDIGESGQNLGSATAPFCTGATGGQGGSQVSGGAGGTFSGSAQYPCVGQAGAALAGGASSGVNGTCNTVGAVAWESGGGQANGGGGGGGSGWFGGGGGGFIWTYCAAGGGGGASYTIPSATSAQTDAGARQTQGNAAASSGAGRGGDRAYDVARSTYDATLGLGANGRIEVTR